MDRPRVSTVLSSYFYYKAGCQVLFVKKYDECRVVGGISALALLNRGFEICLERGAVDLPYIHISAGQRGANIRLAPADLQSLTQATLVDTA